MPIRRTQANFTLLSRTFSVKELIIKANEPLTSQGHVETVP
jgi:hypothetical protein